MHVCVSERVCVPPTTRTLTHRSFALRPDIDKDKKETIQRIQKCLSVSVTSVHVCVCVCMFVRVCVRA